MSTHGSWKSNRNIAIFYYKCKVSAIFLFYFSDRHKELFYYTNYNFNAI